MSPIHSLLLGAILLLIAVESQKCTLCPNGWRYLPQTDHCYLRIRYDNPVEFEFAKLECFKTNSSPASIHSDEENSFLSGMFIHEHVERNPTWIGYRKSSTGKWSWLDGSLNNYSNWYLGYPKVDIPENTCVYLSSIGYWFDVTCSHERTFAIVCKMPSYMTQ